MAIIPLISTIHHLHTHYSMAITNIYRPSQQTQANGRTAEQTPFSSQSPLQFLQIPLANRLEALAQLTIVQQWP